MLWHIYFRFHITNKYRGNLSVDSPRQTKEKLAATVFTTSQTLDRYSTQCEDDEECQDSDKTFADCDIVDVAYSMIKTVIMSWFVIWP